MTKILLQTDTNRVLLETQIGAQDNTLPIWFWIALVEFIVMAFLIIKIKKTKKEKPSANLSKNKIRDAKNADVDMNNLLNSINNSRQLYKELSRACHPDRFINSDKQDIAQEIFQEISKNKRDFKILSKLKEQAINDLNIKIK